MFSYSLAINALTGIIHTIIDMEDIDEDTKEVCINVAIHSFVDANTANEWPTDAVIHLLEVNKLRFPKYTDLFDNMISWIR